MCIDYIGNLNLATTEQFYQIIKSKLITNFPAIMVSNDSEMQSCGPGQQLIQTMHFDHTISSLQYYTSESV